MTEIMLLQLLPSFFLFLLPLLFFFFILRPSSFKGLKNKEHASPSITTTTTLPKSYPLIGSYLAIQANANRRLKWESDIIQASPAATMTLHRLLGQKSVMTANPATVQHILKTHFPNYQKGGIFVNTLSDFLGTGIFNTDGENWKFQRQLASHEFNTKSLRKFVENVVDAELDRLLPILASYSQTQTHTLDFQDILQRFAFDNICKIAFGFDPEYLTPSLKQSKFARAFEDANVISTERFRQPLAIIWKLKRKLNVGSEKRLKEAVSEVRELAKKIVREKKTKIQEVEVDLLSRFLNSGLSDEDLVTDIVISFILAGKDTTSAALTWFFWLLSKNPRVEEEILKEVMGKSESEEHATTAYDEVKEMVYTHAALCESMRLYPPVPTDSKVAANDDVLPDGTVVKKGMMVTYHVYSMGRMESIWGEDWAEFKPERWLKREKLYDSDSGKWKFENRDSFLYPVFNAGPRICLGKEMAFLQMKRVVGGVLRQFRVVPAKVDGVDPDTDFVAYLTSQMKGGFLVRIQRRKGLTETLTGN